MFLTKRSFVSIKRATRDFNHNIDTFVVFLGRRFENNVVSMVTNNTYKVSGPGT